MKVSIVVESMYGNTRALADAMAAALQGAEAAGSDRTPPGLVAEVPGFDVTVLDVAVAAEGIPAGTDLLVVGGPTHAHGLSRSSSRKMAAAEHPDVLVGPGLRDWFDTLEAGEGRLAAAFDTRFRKAEWLTGSAAHGIARRLRHQGWTLAVDAESFFVADAEGPLLDGELERAGRWIVALATGLIPA